MDLISCRGCDEDFLTTMGPDHFGYCPDCHENRPEEVKEHIIECYWEADSARGDNMVLAKALVEFGDIDKKKFLEQDIVHDTRPDWFKEGVDYDFHACECWACGQPATDSLYCGHEECPHRFHEDATETAEVEP